MTRLPFTFDATDDRHWFREAEPAEFDDLTEEEMLPLFERIVELIAPSMALLIESDA